MDGAAARPTLVENINSAFSRENVEISVARLQQISKSRREDFLSISRKLGILGDMDDRRFRRYRKNITLPRLIQQILTTTHHTALFANPPIPMHIEINDATPPSIEITVTDELISIRLNRPDPSARPR